MAAAAAVLRGDETPNKNQPVEQLLPHLFRQ
jgi:hypothetical protein